MSWDSLRKGQTSQCVLCANQSNRPRYLMRRLDAALQRCRNPNCAQYKDYGGRGITFHWPTAGSAVDWVLDNLGEPEPRKLELDRINNDLGYQPGNLRWATRKQQMENSRLPKALARYREKKRLIPQDVLDEAKRIGMHPNTLSSRVLLYKWTRERWFEPVRQQRGPKSMTSPTPDR